MTVLPKVVIAASFVVLAGCTTGVNLEPAPAANEAAVAQEAVVARVNGVQMTVQVDTWPGDPGVTEDVTPVQVSIENNSGAPLRVAYSAFALISPSGIRYSAIPPYNIEGAVDQVELAGAYAPIADPLFTYSNFYAAPIYEPIYSGIGIYNDPYYYDLGYYNAYYDYWGETALPTAAMLARALPEGVVMSGGSVTGFLYFEKVDPDEVDRVRFRADLRNPDSGKVFGEIRIPLILEGED
ncbi:MAG: hypothetical protein L0H73_15065 [Nitrococcus sp.]|nr:hypothetical protein [Nitrococcus sp.]